MKKNFDSKINCFSEVARIFKTVQQKLHQLRVKKSSGSSFLFAVITNVFILFSQKQKKYLRESNNYLYLFFRQEISVVTICLKLCLLF